MSAPFAPALMAELRKLDDVAVLILLGEIVEPSQGGPFRLEEDLLEELAPVTDAYRNHYDGLVCVASGEHDDPEGDYWAEADYRYEQNRDERAERDFNSSVIL